MPKNSFASWKPIFHKMKILFVLEFYYPNVGGVEKLFKSLAEALAKNGDEVLVITNRYDHRLKRKEVINGVNIKRLHLFNRFFFTFFSLPQILRHGRAYDIIHTTSYNAALPAWIAAKLLQKKVIITFHEVWGKLWFKLPFINIIQKTFFYLFEQLILKLPFNKYVAVSDSTKDNLIAHAVQESRIIRIYNGIEYPSENKKMTGKTNDKFTFTYLGRLGISKGLEFLIPAAKAFMSRHPNSIFKFISPKTPTNLYRKIKKLIQKHNLQNDVFFHHNLSQPELKNELLSSDCIVIPSHSEGFCFVAAEAASLKIPIITSGREALKEVVSGEFIVMDDLSKKSLFDALVKANSSNFEFSPLKLFPLDHCIQEYQKLYEKI